ncbi:MAG: FAD-dependent oxidoreductase [Granulosicoccus sp.]|nr:FAD-dependent oxidoreductase [Granulosicoccus sp.]
MISDAKLHVAVIGGGAAGLSAAWLLSKHHKVTLLEKNYRLGGHADTATVSAQMQPTLEANTKSPTRLRDESQQSDLKIDTGFIVYNEPCYPNLTRWFQALGVDTEKSDMSFSVSREHGQFEYAGGPLLGLIAQRSLPFKARFWSMMRDLLRFYRHARKQIGDNQLQTLGEFLAEHNYSDAFVQDHLLPFGAAIWSTPKAQMLDYPALAFIRFCDNHGLLRLSSRPQWRTVTGGSVQYVAAVQRSLGPGSVHTDFDVHSINRTADQVCIRDQSGNEITVDQVVIATHADQALQMIECPSEDETRLLTPFRYEKNRAVLHTDESCMPRRKRAWCSWNYVEQDSVDTAQVSVSYWMNLLQNLPTDTNFFVSLNPAVAPKPDSILLECTYEHPVFNTPAFESQQALWSLQGCQRTWFCGSYFGAGFHEDAVQSGLAVAEQLGPVIRPWSLENPSSRIVVNDDWHRQAPSITEATA